jgi:hypothetical protein
LVGGCTFGIEGKIWGVRTKYTEPNKWTAIRPYWTNKAKGTPALTDEEIKKEFTPIAEHVIGVIRDMEHFRMFGKRLNADQAAEYLDDIRNFENEGGMVYSEEKKPMEPYVPEWACRRWGGYEHDWLDCMDCQANYEVYLEENESRVEADATNPPPAHNSSD